MNILALDPATRTGWATNEASGTWDLSVKKDESSGMRLLRLRAKLNEIDALCGIDLVVFEAVRYAGLGAGAANAISVQSEIQGVIKVWCEDSKIEYRGYSSTQIKKHATGKGNAGKPAMVDAACKKWKRVFQDKDDNEVDALFLLDLAQHDLCLNL